jgi:hypothetical protein
MVENWKSGKPNAYDYPVRVGVSICPFMYGISIVNELYDHGFLSMSVV